MNILFVINRFDERFKYEEVESANELVKFGHELTVICAQLEMDGISNCASAKILSNKREEWITKGGVRVIRLPILVRLYSDIVFVKHLLHEIKAVDPEIVHLHTNVHGLSLAGALFCKLLKIQYVVDNHDFLFSSHPLVSSRTTLKAWIKYIEFRVLRKAVALFIMRYAHTVISVNGGCTSLLRDFYQLPDERITELHLAVDTDFFAPLDCEYTRQKRRPKNHKNPTILVPGVMTERKQPWRYIQVLAAVTKEHLTAELIFAGSMSEEVKKIVFDMADKYGLRSKTTVTGLLTPHEMLEFYRNADLSLFLYSNSIAILESMSSGTPVVSTPQQFSNVLSSLNLLVNSEEDAAIKINKLFGDRNLLSKLSRDSRSLMIRHYSIYQYAKQLETIYRDATP
jgi:glycosyltransferase involved in cell wall biosynthesis